MCGAVTFHTSLQIRLRSLPADCNPALALTLTKNAGVWGCIQAALYEQTRAQAGRSECPSVVIMDGQSVKTTERGGVRGFDGYKRVKGRKRHILVDTLGLPIANRVEPANIADRICGGTLAGRPESFVSRNSDSDG